MKANILACLLTLLLLWFFSTLAWGAEVDQGQKLYLQYCSSCHGIDGRGNGTVTPYLKLKVPDLSLLKKNHKGIYPFNDVMTAIDGSRAVRGPGDRQMPGGGEVFRKERE